MGFVADDSVGHLFFLAHVAKKSFDCQMRQRHTNATCDVVKIGATTLNGNWTNQEGALRLFPRMKS